MSRLGKTPPPPPKIPQKPSAQQASQANQNKGTFSKKLQRKDDRGKQSQTKQAPTKGSSDKQPPAALLRQTSANRLSARKGTVADLQNQLAALNDQGKGGKADALGQKGLDGTGDLSLDGQLQGDLAGQNALDGNLAAGGQGAADGLQGLQQVGGQNAVQGGTFEISNGKIPTAMMEKIVDTCRMGTTKAGGTQLQFDLKGDVLGGMKMDITYENGKLKATFLSENNEVRKLMDENMKHLERNLRDRGIVIESLEVRDPKQQQRDQQNQQRQKERQEMIDLGDDA